MYYVHDYYDMYITYGQCKRIIQALQTAVEYVASDFFFCIFLEKYASSGYGYLDNFFVLIDGTLVLHSLHDGIWIAKQFGAIIVCIRLIENIKIISICSHTPWNKI